MDDKKFRIALIVRDQEMSQGFQDILSVHEDLNVDVYQNIQHFIPSSKENEYSGILVDVQTLVGSTTEEKEFIFKIYKKIPVVNLAWNFDRNEFKSFMEGKGLSHLKGEEALEYFIRRYIRCDLPVDEMEK